MNALYDPSFWRAFLAKLPPFNDVAEERALTALATRTGLSTEFVRARMEAYLHLKHGKAGSDMVH